MSLDKSGSEYSVSIVHHTEVLERISGRDSREVMLRPVVKLEITSNFIGPYSMNWLYVSAESKSILRNKATLVDVPYRPDMMAVEHYEFDDTTMSWFMEEAIDDYRSWRTATRAIVIMSGGTFGGAVEVLSKDETTNRIITTRPYLHNLEFEAVYLVPIIKGRYKACVIEKNRVEAEIETYKEYVYG